MSNWPQLYCRLNQSVECLPAVNSLNALNNVITSELPPSDSLTDKGQNGINAHIPVRNSTPEVAMCNILSSLRRCIMCHDLSRRPAAVVNTTSGDLIYSQFTRRHFVLSPCICDDATLIMIDGMFSCDAAAEIRRKTTRWRQFNEFTDAILCRLLHHIPVRSWHADRTFFRAKSSYEFLWQLFLIKTRQMTKPQQTPITHGKSNSGQYDNIHTTYAFNHQFILVTDIRRLPLARKEDILSGEILLVFPDLRKPRNLAIKVYRPLLVIEPPQNSREPKISYRDCVIRKLEVGIQTNVLLAQP